MTEQTFICSNCKAEIKLKKGQKPDFTKADCCPKPKYLLSILGNHGKIKQITYSEYCSYKNNGWVKENEKGEEILNIYEENKDKKNKKEEKVDYLLSKEKRPYQSLAIGIHNDDYYFGFVLEEEKGKKINAIITDKGSVYACWNSEHDDEIRDEFGLNYRFELFDDVIDNLWSNKSIKEFKEGKAKKLDFRELFDRIVKCNKKYVYHPDERIHSFIACDIIKSYFYVIFNSMGRTYFQADFGSGKTRQSTVYNRLSFNSLFASNISPAAFERVIESTGGTIIVDNFDNCNEELKKAILQVIEVYYKKGGKNIKADGTGKQKNKPIAFNGYSPLVINNILGLPEVTESRCNKIQMLKTNKKLVVDKKINEKDPFWSTLKDDLHILALQRWKEIRKVYQKLEVPELSARDLERVEGILTIAKMIGEDVYEKILNWVLENNEQQSIQDIHDNWEFIIFEHLNNLIKQGEQRVKIKSITEAVASKIVKSETSAKKDKDGFSRYAGKILNGVVLFKRIIIHGWVHYVISREDLDKVLKIKGFDKYLTLPYPSNPMSPIPPNNTHITLNNNNNENNKNNSNLKGKLGDKGDKGDLGYPQTKKIKENIINLKCTNCGLKSAIVFEGDMHLCEDCIGEANNEEKDKQT